jgi:hypothetical protein
MASISKGFSMSAPTPGLPVPTAQSPFHEWQDAYNVYATHYARMSEDLRDTGNYRAQDNGMKWIKKMVDASLGAIWLHAFPGTKPEKRALHWQRLEQNSVLLPPAVWIERFGDAGETDTKSSIAEEVLPNQAEIAAITAIAQESTLSPETESGNTYALL